MAAVFGVVPMSMSCPCVGVSCTERAGNLVVSLVVRPPGLESPVNRASPVTATETIGVDALITCIAELCTGTYRGGDVRRRVGGVLMRGQCSGRILLAGFLLCLDLVLCLDLDWVSTPLPPLQFLLLSSPIANFAHFSSSAVSLGLLCQSCVESWAGQNLSFYLKLCGR